ncbi:VacJ family lipoprotein [Lysobacter hankyongensis]|uniref:VacJ family lipoprotein n=1 Tax=Lysobacter hankyongensis TaxID=1176535 RepID=A0ABP9C7V9_9GAMM
MNQHRLLPRAAFLAAALFASGCAHQAVTQDAPPPVAVVAAADTPAAQTAESQTAESTVDANAQAPIDASTQTAEVVAGAEPASLQPTDAERDFAAIYGAPEPQVYDPIADPNLPEPAALPQSYDPWEKYNRRVHRFNDVVDRRVAKPLATAYVKVVPRPVRLGVSNFFNNLGQPVSAVNALLQGKPKQAGQSIGRFLLNSTLGIGGLFDPATSAKLPNKSEDFGQTLGVWGWKKSRYVELPLFGPRTVRDALGMAGDAPLSPIRPIEEDKVRVFLQGLQLVNVRTQLLSVDRMREGAADDYALVRDAWLQRRNYQISGDRADSDDEAALPEYLQNNEDNPTVPIDAIPVIPGSP